MSRSGQVIAVYVTSATIATGRLRALAAQGTALALVVPSTFDTDDATALRTEIPLLKGAPRITIHREDATAGVGFQHTISDALKQHGKLDAIITEDGEIISRTWPNGSDDDKTQLMMYAAFTDVQARQLRRRLIEPRG